MPYEFHPDLRTPRNSVVLWRYMDFAKFIEMVESRTLWFVRIDHLDDPLEGTHTDAELAHIRKNLIKKRAEQLIDVFRSARSSLYVNCWRSGSTESLAMWDLYGKGSGIIAVKSTVGRIRESIITYDKPVYISKVKYVGWNDAPGLDNVLVASSRKDLCYQHESEVRVIISEESTKPSVRVRVPVDLDRLIIEVMVGPREGDWVKPLAKRLMKRYKLPQQIIASNRLTPRR
jgi:hypothetical protein